MSLMIKLIKILFPCSFFCILKYKVKGIKHSHTTMHLKGAAMMKVE
jgi:hypothetical protein